MSLTISGGDNKFKVLFILIDCKIRVFCILNACVFLISHLCVSCYRHVAVKTADSRHFYK